MALSISTPGASVPGLRIGSNLRYTTAAQTASPATGAAGQTDTEIANLEAQSVEQDARAAAARVEATGKKAEADAYGTAAGIATESGRLEQAAVQIARFQQTRLVDKTIGAQRAAVAASGFKEAGSSLYILRDSIQQGHITDALTNIQGNINASGFYSQAASALGAQAAASAASDADLILAQQEADAGALALANSATLAESMKPSALRYAEVGNIFSNASFNVRSSGGRSQSPSPAPSPTPASPEPAATPRATYTGGDYAGGSAADTGGAPRAIDTGSSNIDVGGGGSLEG